MCVSEYNASDGWSLIRMKRSSRKHSSFHLTSDTRWQIHQSFVSSTSANSPIKIQKLSNFFHMNKQRTSQFSFSNFREIPFSMSYLYVIMGSCRVNPSEEPAGRRILGLRHPSQGLVLMTCTQCTQHLTILGDCSHIKSPLLSPPGGVSGVWSGQVWIRNGEEREE